MSDVTRLIEAAQGGDRHAAAELLPLVYDELRKLAAARMAAETPGHTLSATALVHEAYLRLVSRPEDDHWNGRGHFFAAAAEAMRRILVERARQRTALKYGGGSRRVPLCDLGQIEQTPDGLLAVDEALDRFALEDPQKADLVKLRFFGGRTMPQVAAALGISLATAERWWTYAKAWLVAELSDAE